METGAEVKGYRVLRKLGTGGFGAVYLVEKEGRRYALKQLSDNLINPDISERFIKEALRMEEIRRQHNIGYLVRIYEVMFDRKAFVMEYIPEGSIPYFKKGPDPDFLKTLIQVIHLLHELGIAHRDIKPENLRVKNRQPVLIDFGVASWWDSHSNIIPTGTRYYSPPEIVCMFDEYRYAQAAKKASRDLIGIKPDHPRERVKYIKKLHDVYSLGITIGELLTGTLPFNKLSYFEYLDQGNSEAYRKWLGRIPVPFRDFVSRATVFSPDNRLPLQDIIRLSTDIFDGDFQMASVTISLPGGTSLDFIESDYQCNECDRAVQAPVTACPHCGAAFSAVGLVVEPDQQVVINADRPQVFKLKITDRDRERIMIALDMREKDFALALGRDPERTDISFPDDNWMSGIHGHLIKKGDKVFFQDGNRGKLPTNPSHYNNIPLGHTEIELLAGSFLLSGSTVLSIRKYMGAVD